VGQALLPVLGRDKLALGKGGLACARGRIGNPRAQARSPVAPLSAEPSSRAEISADTSLAQDEICPLTWIKSFADK